VRSSVSARSSTVFSARTNAAPTALCATAVYSITAAEWPDDSSTSAVAARAGR
jgi:hypothetical protein